ncbi:MAG: ChbG/HpnK family deacetylase, partial [Methylophilaceae bacterium]
MKPIIVCADDFAQSAGIDAAIIALIQQGRLSATSCMTLSPRWPAAATLISEEIRHQADIGLHLDFTQYAQPLKHSLPMLIARAVSHSLPAKKIYTSINSQLDNFENALGTAPDY